MSNAKKPILMQANAPVLWTPEEQAAVLAWSEGRADPRQQKLAWDFVIYKAAALEEQQFELGGEDGRRATDFALGRRFAGDTIRKLTHPIYIEAAQKRREQQNQ